MPKFLPLQFPAGMHSNGPEYANKGVWLKGNLVRWNEGWMRPVGGWARFGRQSPLQGVPRAMFTWQDNAMRGRIAIGTESKLYLHDGALATDITPSDLVDGNATGSLGLGYGAGLYGKSSYGTPRSGSGRVLGATVWDLANFGENLVALSPADGRVFWWRPNTGGAADALATPITNAPDNNIGVVVTDERCVLLIGADGDPRRVQWSSIEDATDWTPTATNTAGALQLTTDGMLVNAAKLQGEVLLLTTDDAHVLRFIGTPLVYGVQRVGSGCGLVAPHAHAEAAGFCVWLSRQGFYVYDGAVRPLPCEVWTAVFDNLTEVQLSKVVAGTLAAFHEVWWFYPSAHSQENDSYVIWNYQENWWATGSLSRTAWADAGVMANPIAARDDGTLFIHESGWTADGAARAGTGLIWAETAPFDLGDGDRVLHATQLVPDTDKLGADALTYEFKLRFTPNGPQHTTGKLALSRPDGYIDTRFSGRQAVLRVEPAKDGPFQLGRLRLAVQPEGQR